MSESQEHYTPPEIVDLAHAVLGGIDLDPASCALANTVVRASRFYNKTVNGYDRTWTGRVFLNPPGGQCDDLGRQALPGCNWSGSCGRVVRHEHRGIGDAVVAWWRMLMWRHEIGDVHSAMFVGVSLDVLRSTQGLTGKTPLDYPFCVTQRGVRYLSPSGGKLKRGKRLKHGSVIVYLPPRGNEYASSAQLFLNLASELGQARWAR